MPKLYQAGLCYAFCMEVSILQWNIWFKEDINNIIDFIESINPDIICLQELSINNPEQPTKDTVSYVAEKLDYNFCHKELNLGEDKIAIANGIFSRYPLTNNRHVMINQPTGTGKFDDEWRAYVETVVNINGAKLKVGTVHMSYTHAFENTPRKLQETENLIEATKDNKSNFIITGDFNAVPGSQVIERIEQAGLKNCGPDLSQKSWTTKPFDYSGFTANTLDWRLDYALATPDIQVNSAEILKTDFSDHLPLLIRIDV